MSIKYNKFGLETSSNAYLITNENGDDIGSVEGFGNEYGEFISVVKIYNPKFQKQRIGFNAFKKVFDEINAIHPIKIIVGCWNKGGEFKDFKDGMSTNMKIFLDAEKDGKTSEESAFLTPTGKWAKQLGYINC